MFHSVPGFFHTMAGCKSFLLTPVLHLVQLENKEGGLGENLFTVANTCNWEQS